MFTGLIEAVGRVADVTAHAGGVTLRIETALATDLASGDSLAVNGVCLTVTAIDHGSVQADLGPETLRVTTLGSLRSGSLVNLERSLRADARFGGHFVLGHVDSTGTLENITADGDARWLAIGFQAADARLLVPKGSIAVDGVSLTIATLDRRRFEVMIVPFTWTHTNLSQRHVGDAVNLEFDIVGKYVARATDLTLHPTP